ncbi:MAG TPA: ABC transporter permease [Clostridiales bacterium]|jgi:peptide/nickel transport system permease protein|nr:ABC transporter permease [Clostridiales bacterium]
MKNPETAVTTKKKNRSRAGETWHRLKKNKGAMLGLAIIILLVLIALYTSIFWDYNTMIVKVNIPERVQPPSPVHPFGTDDMGRDVLIRTLYGTRYSLIIGFGATAIGLIIGVLLGAVAGYFGGIYEDIIMRATDIFASIPAILMGMVIVCVLGASLPNLLIAVGITAVPAFTRITRSMVLTIRNQEYIEAAKCIGTPNLKIIITEVIPNSLSPIIVVASSRIGSCTIQAAGLSFLGFGVPAPAPEWGAMISLSRNYIRTAPWMTLFPSLFIIIMVLAFNILGDGLRDALDPKLKR